MRVGVIGTGGIGKAFATQLVRAGVEALLAARRGPDSLAPLVAELGGRTRAVTPREALAAPMVFVAVKWPDIPAAVRDAPPWNGRIFIDPSNPLVPPDFVPADLGGRTSSEVVAELVPGARVVKAFNTLTPEMLAKDPRVAGGRRVMFCSGDDEQAKAEVGALIERLGFACVDLGSLKEGGRMQQYPGGPLPGLDLIRMD